jgi:hypothetical protein
MSELQSELSPLLMSLKPNSLGNGITEDDEFPFLALKIENEWNSIHMGRSVLSGDYCIEEMEVDNGSDTSIPGSILAEGNTLNVIQRRLIFLSNQNLIQTEVQLVESPLTRRKKDKKKNRHTSSTSNMMNDVWAFHYSYIDDHHRGFLAALLCSPGFVKKAHSGLRAVVIGLGGGALCMYLQRYLPAVILDIIELEPTMLCMC